MVFDYLLSLLNSIIWFFYWSICIKELILKWNLSSVTINTMSYNWDMVWKNCNLTIMHKTTPPSVIPWLYHINREGYWTTYTLKQKEVALSWSFFKSQTCYIISALDIWYHFGHYNTLSQVLYNFSPWSSSWIYNSACDFLTLLHEETF